MSLSNSFPDWGETGESPPSGHSFSNGDQYNEKYLDFLWDQVNKTFDEIVEQVIVEDGSVSMGAALDLDGNNLESGSTVAYDGSVVPESVIDPDIARDSELHSKYTDAEARTAVEGAVDAADLTGSSGSDGQLLQTDGTAADWEHLETLHVRDLYQRALASLARGDYFGDIYPGILAAADYKTVVTYGTVGEVIESFSSVNTFPTGIAVDPADGTLWHVDADDSNIYHLERGGTTISSIPTPSSGPHGIAVDPADGTLWHTDLDDNVVYHLERDGSEIDLVFPPKSDPRGITIDLSDGTLWIGYGDGSLGIHHLERDGSEIDLIVPPSTGVAHGIAVDPADGTLWDVDSDNDDIYHLERDGTQIDSFGTPSAISAGITVDPADGTLWYTDSDGDSIYHVNRFSSAREIVVGDATFAMREL